MANNEFNEHVTTQFVRMNATKGGAFGTSVVEFQIYGTPANSCIAPAVANMTATSITRKFCGSELEAGYGSYEKYIVRNTGARPYPVILPVW